LILKINQTTMKTKNPLHSRLLLKLILLIPVLFLLLFLVNSCSASRKASKTTAEASPPPPQNSINQKPVIESDDTEVPFVMVEEMPMFPGGDKELLKYIAENTKYPEIAKENKIQGRVIIRFCVTAKGGVSQISILKGVSTELDNEGMRVVSTLPAFSPGKQGGKPVPVWYMVPITFTLNNDAVQRKSRFEVTGTDTVYIETENNPQFTGGYEALKKFKTENLKYPQELKNLGIEGIVNVRFIVEKNGSVSNVRIIMGASPGLDAEAIRVTKLMPAWQPGKEKGKPVRFLYMTGYEFLLNPRTMPVPEDGTPFVVVEEMPMFPGGDSALLGFIARNTKYPEKAKANGIEGRVIIRFCVTDVGGIDRVSVLKGVDAELDNEAIRVVKTLPQFKPGKQGGKPVNVWYMVPITFGLKKPVDPTAPKPPPPPPAPPIPGGYDEPPVFAGGETAMYKFINSNLKYPQAAKENGISGKVNLRFSINTDGTIGEVSVLKGINPDLDAEAIRVIKLLPAWKPAKLEGKPVIVNYMVPINFTLK
jgi:TonB family protein